MSARLVAVVAATLLVAAAQAAPADNSLSPGDYMARGMPAPDRPWSGDDYAATATMLGSLTMDQLPRETGSVSSPVFARMTDPGNLLFCNQQSTGLKVRFKPCLTMLQATNQVLTLYLNAFNKGGGLATEMVDIAGYEVQVAASNAGLVDEFIPTLDSNDPSYAARMAGLKQAQDGLAEMFDGALTMLSDSQTISDTTRIKLAKTLAANFPQIATQLPPLSKTEFEKKLRRFAQADPSEGVRAALGDYASLKP